MVKRRKKVAAEQSRSKDTFTPPSSSGPVTSTTTSSQSVPSYHSSKTESVPRSFYFGVQVFTYAELEEATNNFHPSRELGEGGFGTVYKGKKIISCIFRPRKMMLEHNFVHYFYTD